MFISCTLCILNLLLSLCVYLCRTFDLLFCVRACYCIVHPISHMFVYLPSCSLYAAYIGLSSLQFLSHPHFRADSLSSVAVLRSSIILHLRLTIISFPSVFSRSIDSFSSSDSSGKLPCLLLLTALGYHNIIKFIVWIENFVAEFSIKNTIQSCKNMYLVPDWFIVKFPIIVPNLIETFLYHSLIEHTLQYILLLLPYNL